MVKNGFCFSCGPVQTIAGDVETRVKSLPNSGWVAYYKDNSLLPQFNKDGTENKYSSIDRGQLNKFELIINKIPIVTLYLKPNQQVIYRRTSIMKGDRNIGVVYKIGYFEGKKFTIMYLHEDGRIYLDDDRKDIVLTKEEEKWLR